MAHFLMVFMMILFVGVILLVATDVPKLLRFINEKIAKKHEQE